jgi:Flp pilus assembly protein TadD
LAWRRVERRVGHSAFARRVAQIYERLYEWWYPILDDPYPYYGYYGRKRKSLPVVTWRKLERWIRNSWLGQLCSQYVHRFYEWWYPPFQVSSAHYPHYGYGQVSRPVLAFRRWNRWFRKTWVGREFGWILDEFTFLVYFAQAELAQALSRRRIERFLSRKRNIAVLVGIVLITVAGYTYGRPRYRHYVEQQYARQAEQFMLKGDFARAYLRARQVMAINPENAVACRVNAELADWANSPFALYWRQRTVLLAPTATNRLALASTALKAEQFPYATAAKTLDEIEPEFRRTASFHLIAGALAVKLDHLSDAEQHYAEAVKLQPDNPVTRMSLAVVQLQSKDTKIVTDSRITLELLNTDGKLGILPLRTLVAESTAARDFARAERLSNQVLTNARASFGDRILHLSILHAAGRTNFQSFLNETQQKALQHPVYIGELAGWLNQSGLAADALTWLRELPRQVSSRGLIPMARADSYVALGEWKALETYIEGEHWVGQDHIRIAMLALALRKQAGSQGSALAWDRAIRLASDAPTALSMLAQLALNWGWVPEAEQVLWHAASKFPKQPWPLAPLQNLYIARRDTAGLRRVYQAMMQQDPKDKLARNNFTMLSLLSGKDLPTAHTNAVGLYTGQPTNPVFASTYAFSLHLQGKTKEGVEVLRALKPEDLANPAVAVYYGVLLSAAGDAQASKDYLDKSNKAFLLPEELALVNSARKLN